MKKGIIIITTILCMLSLVVPSSIYAANSTEYTIDSYDIVMVVNEDNSFDITEKITAYFNVPKHGIFRKLPLSNTITRLDGTTSRNRAKISDIEVSEDYTLSREDGNQVIKIGSASKTFTGSHSYTLKYKYSIGKDPLKDADELYFNLIGNYWDTSIRSVTFKIVMPKEFDKNLLGFSTGVKGSTESSYVSYDIDGNVITGRVTKTLNAGEGLNIRLTLDEGYFSEAQSNIDVLSLVAISVSVLSVVIFFILWKIFGKDEKPVETVEFYPPEGYNSAEIGYMYRGKADDKSIISLLIYLADKGYVKIEENEEKGIFKNKKGFTIIKVKDYDGTNEYEKIFFNGLFKKRGISQINAISKLMEEAKQNGEKLSFEEAEQRVEDEGNKTVAKVTEDDLYDSFYTTLGRIKTSLNAKENKKKLFDPKASRIAIFIVIAIIAIFALITAPPVLEYYPDPEILFFALLFPAVGFTVLFSMLFSRNAIATKLFALVWGLGFGGGPWAFLVLPALLVDEMYMLTYVVGVIAIIILIIFAKIMPKRTKFGTEMLGKIKGFKRFLETAEKEQLESLVSQAPEYFYNILPYTYALGVSDKWVKKFETIALTAPNWYNSPSAFNMSNFGSFMTSTMSSASRAMSSSPSSSSGGSSSGGGSSGGGSGGGGGGSW